MGVVRSSGLLSDNYRFFPYVINFPNTWVEKDCGSGFSFRLKEKGLSLCNLYILIHFNVMITMLSAQQQNTGFVAKKVKRSVNTRLYFYLKLLFHLFFSFDNTMISLSPQDTPRSLQSVEFEMSLHLGWSPILEQALASAAYLRISNHAAVLFSRKLLRFRFRFSTEQILPVPSGLNANTPVIMIRGIRSHSIPREQSLRDSGCRRIVARQQTCVKLQTSHLQRSNTTRNSHLRVDIENLTQILLLQWG